MTQNSLAKLLEPYKIRPGNIRIGPRVPKGYSRRQFTDAWGRYLSPAEPPKQTATPLHPSNGAGSGENHAATKSENVAPGNSREPSNGAGCSGVAVQNRVTREVL